MNAFSESNIMTGKVLTGDDLLRVGRSLKVLAIIVIVLLSLGVAALAIRQWMESATLRQIFQTDGQLVYGFGLLMLLTVGYLVGFIVPFLPGGLGAREGTLVAVLATRYGAGAATGVALATRVAATLGELVSVGLIWFCFYGRRALLHAK